MELLILVFVAAIFIKERESMCEDHFNSKNRVIAMKNSNANCTWTVAEPEYNRVWMRVSVLQTKKDNSTVCQNSLMLEEIKDNQKHLLERYCTPVARDYVKSNFNQILVTAYNIKFKISWNGLERKKKSLQTVDLQSATERTSLQRTKSVHTSKTTMNSFQKEKAIYAAIEENKYIVIGSSSGLLFVFVVGFITKKRCYKRSNHITKEQTYEMHPPSIKTEHKNCSHENSQTTSKKSRGHPKLQNLELSESNKSNEILAKTGIMRSYQEKGETNQSLTRSQRRANDINKEHEYSLANFTGGEEEDHLYQECRFVNKMDDGVFCIAYHTSKTDPRHLSALSYESAEYVNLN